MSEPLSIPEYLEAHGSLTYSNVGVSMRPLLRQGKDLFILRKKGAERCRVGDVVLYRRPPDSYVLHRVLEVLPQGYVILGDNCVRLERDIPEEAILGVMTGFVRGGKSHSVTERGYRLYTALILRTVPLRVPLKKAARRVKRALKRRLG